MKFKSLILVFLFSILSFTLIFCSDDKVDISSTRSYSDEITKEILNSINNLDYDNFIKNLDNNMKEIATNETEFLSLVMPIKGAIGTYEENSLEFVRAKKSKDYINMLYKAKFSDETEPVNISISFDENNHKISGLYFNSPKIKELYNK